MTALAVALLVGSVAAFTYTQKLKLERSPIGRTTFDRWLSPGCGCEQDTARLRFQLRERERIDATIVDADGERVRTLLTASDEDAGPVELEWDGRDDAGEVAPDGDYRVRVRMRDERRTIVIPVEVHVDTVPPRVALRGVSTTVLAPGETVELTYETNEFGTPLLLVDGEIAATPPPRKPGRNEVLWAGEAGETELVPGLYAVTFIVEDQAGNRSEPTRPTHIAVVADTR
jgi:hypothetical protein